ncbi:MAG: hypothetical protein KA171_24825, partial [Reyranella sp.]|nr:hypothetical protein [Reyranella sp.]
TRQGEIRGRAIGMDDQGALLVETVLDDGAKRVDAVRVGDVHLLPATDELREGGADAGSDR